MDDDNNNRRDNNDKKGNNKNQRKKRELCSTTSLGKRRKLIGHNNKRGARRATSPSAGYNSQDEDNQSPTRDQQQHTQNNPQNDSAQNQKQQHQHSTNQQQQQNQNNNKQTSPSNLQQHKTESPNRQQSPVSTMSEPRTSEYGSQANIMRVPLRKADEKLTKVTIIGAGGGIGQPLSLLLMLHSEYIQHLALYDLAHVRGVAADLGHVDKQCLVTSHLGPEELVEAVKDASVIVILAGIAQKPGMSRDDLFGTNAKIILDLAKVCATHAPEAHLAVVSNPVNSLVPIVNQVYKHIFAKSTPVAQQQDQANNKDLSHNKSEENANNTKKSLRGQSRSPTRNSNKHDDHQANKQADGESSLPAWSKRIFGVTTLDVVRASTLVAKSPFLSNQEHANASSGLFKDPAKVSVPVVGGHAGKTILPLLSRATPTIDKKKLTEDMRLTNKVIESVQEAGIDVLNAKRGAGSATLAMAYAACRFTVSLLRAQLGENNIVECAYVRHPKPVFENLDYFALPLTLGKNGYTKVHNILNKLVPFENEMVEVAAKLLRANVARGEDFAKEQLSLEKN